MNKDQTLTTGSCRGRAVKCLGRFWLCPMAFINLLLSEKHLPQVQALKGQVLRRLFILAGCSMHLSICVRRQPVIEILSYGTFQ
jgi:hypothetical protein